MLDAPPFLFTVQNLKHLNLQLAVKWPFGDKFGWEIGRFKKLASSGPHRNSFVIKFEDNLEVYWPREPNTEYGSNKKWVLIQRSAA